MHRFYHAVNLALRSDFRKLAKAKKEFGNWKSAWESLSPDAKTDADREWEKFASSGVRLVLFEDADYPELLREIPHPPFGIYIRGNFPDPKRLSVAVVGTRKATEEGLSFAREFARDLVASGAEIISGLALGVDAAAHRGALTGGGRTFAVLGSGADVIYPHTNERLGKEILEKGGGILSEYPPGMPPLPYRFLERNRIVSGLSQGTLVIEAPDRSGSLVTARFALDQNRDVFVLPGPARHPNYRGSHELIRKGALLVTKPEDVLEAFGIVKEAAELKAGSDEELICEIIKNAPQPLSVDEIAETAKMGVSRVNQIISLLVIQNIIADHGERYSIQK